MGKRYNGENFLGHRALEMPLLESSLLGDTRLEGRNDVNEDVIQDTVINIVINTGHNDDSHLINMMI